MLGADYDNAERHTEWNGNPKADCNNDLQDLAIHSDRGQGSPRAVAQQTGKPCSRCEFCLPDKIVIRPHFFHHQAI
jgi:hypothetical protein